MFYAQKSTFKTIFSLRTLLEPPVEAISNLFFYFLNLVIVFFLYFLWLQTRLHSIVILIYFHFKNYYRFVLKLIEFESDRGFLSFVNHLRSCGPLPGRHSLPGLQRQWVHTFSPWVNTSAFSAPKALLKRTNYALVYTEFTW